MKSPEEQHFDVWLNAELESVEQLLVTKGKSKMPKAKTEVTSAHAFDVERLELEAGAMESFCRFLKAADLTDLRLLRDTLMDHNRMTPGEFSDVMRAHADRHDGERES